MERISVLEEALWCSGMPCLVRSALSMESLVLGVKRVRG